MQNIVMQPGQQEKMNNYSNTSHFFLSGFIFATISPYITTCSLYMIPGTGFLIPDTIIHFSQLPVSNVRSLLYCREDWVPG
jgi:hypothetical protein